MRVLFALGTAARRVAQRAAGRRETAELSRALLVGTVTQRALVAGQEVARARYDEMTRT